MIMQQGVRATSAILERLCAVGEAVRKVRTPWPEHYAGWSCLDPTATIRGWRRTRASPLTFSSSTTVERIASSSETA